MSTRPRPRRRASLRVARRATQLPAVKSTSGRGARAAGAPDRVRAVYVDSVLAAGPVPSGGVAGSAAFVGRG